MSPIAVSHYRTVGTAAKRGCRSQPSTSTASSTSSRHSSSRSSHLRKSSQEGMADLTNNPTINHEWLRRQLVQMYSPAALNDFMDSYHSQQPIQVNNDSAIVFDSLTSAEQEERKREEDVLLSQLVHLNDDDDDFKRSRQSPILSPAPSHVDGPDDDVFLSEPHSMTGDDSSVSHELESSSHSSSEASVAASCSSSDDDEKEDSEEESSDDSYHTASDDMEPPMPPRSPIKTRRQRRSAVVRLNKSEEDSNSLPVRRVTRTVIPSRRKRGRPSKQEQAETLRRRTRVAANEEPNNRTRASQQSLQENKSEEKPRRPRGRPRKHPLPDSEPIVEEPPSKRVALPQHDKVAKELQQKESSPLPTPTPSPIPFALPHSVNQQIGQLQLPVLPYFPSAAMFNCFPPSVGIQQTSEDPFLASIIDTEQDSCEDGLEEMMRSKVHHYQQPTSMSASTLTGQEDCMFKSIVTEQDDCVFSAAAITDQKDCIFSTATLPYRTHSPPADGEDEEFYSLWDSMLMVENSSHEELPDLESLMAAKNA
jgi:hypothetical protein